MLSALPGTVELWAFQIPSARFSSWPAVVRHCCRSSPGRVFCTRLVSRSSPFRMRVRNWALYQITVSPESSAAGWDSGSRLNCTLDFSKLVPLIQRDTQRRSW